MAYYRLADEHVRRLLAVALTHVEHAPATVHPEHAAGFDDAASHLLASEGTEPAAAPAAGTARTTPTVRTALGPTQPARPGRGGCGILPVAARPERNDRTAVGVRAARPTPQRG